MDWALTRPRRTAVKTERMVVGCILVEVGSKGEASCIALVPGPGEKEKYEAAQICSPAGDGRFYGDWNLGNRMIEGS